LKEKSLATDKTRINTDKEVHHRDTDEEEKKTFKEEGGQKKRWIRKSAI
jgi:hypothetical protein